MPNETINETLSSLAKNTPGIGSTAEGSWAYTGPGPIWAPHRLKEFWGAYNNIPFANTTIIGTGNINSATLYISIGGEYSATNPSFYSFDGGVWTQLAAGATATIGIGRASYTVAVKDWFNCGTNRELVKTVTYP
jgi:hypothetical protein